MAAEQQEWTVDEYETPSSEAPVMTLLNSLTDRRAVKEAAALLLQLRARGNTLREPRSKALGEGLYELRGQQVRIFYMFRPGRRITLLDGMVKKQDRIPADLMARLRRFQQEIEALDARRHAP